MTKKATSVTSNLKPKISKPQSLRVLVVEDSEDDALLVIRELKKGGYDPVYERVETEKAMSKALKEKQWDVILCDYTLPKFSVTKAIALLKEINIDIPFLLVTGSVGEEVAVECMRLGAHDYIMKNNLSRLCLAIARELKEAEVRNEHKLSEQALRESEEKYRTILEDMEEGYFEIDLKGNFTFVNDAQCRNLGYSREELIGMNNRQYTDKENAKKAFQAFSNLHKTGEPSKIFDYEVIKKDGTKVVSELLVSLIKDSRGKPIGFRGVSRDVTERKQAESQREAALEALQGSEEYFKEITENSSDIIVITDKNGDIKYCSRSIERFSGYKPEELIGRNVLTIIHPDDKKRAVGDFGKAILTKDSAIPNAFRIVHKDGSERYFEGLGKNLLDNPSVAGFIMNVRDTTERKQMEEALRRSEEKYRAIIEEMEDGYYETDLAGNFTFVNDSLCKIHGYAREELMGMNDRQYADEENAKKVFKFFNKIYRTGESGKIFDNEVIRKDGTKRQIEVSGSLKKDSLGNPIGFRGITRDITERKQAEEVLRQSEEKYRTIIETMQDGYFEIDLAGNFTFVNDAQCKITGTPREQLLGKNNRDYTSEEEAKRLYQIYSRIYRTGEPEKGYAFAFTRIDGTKGFHEVSASLIRDAKGKPIGFRGVSRDVTERKQMEEVLRQSEEKYRTIIETMQDGYFEIDLAGRYTFANEALRRRQGYPKEELIGMSNRQFQNETNAKKAYQAFNEVYRTGEPINALEMEVIKKDGTRGFSELSVSLIRDAQGKPIGFRGLSHDVTERKQMEETLRQSEEKYRTILEDMEEGYSEIDLAGNFTFVNDKVVRDLGYTKEELIGTNSRRYRDGKNEEEIYQRYNELYKTGKTIRALGLVYVGKNGMARTYEMTASLIRDEQGKPTGFRGVTRDITERKQMQETIRQSEEKYRTILETMQEGYYELDLAGHMTFVNDTVCRHLGYTKEELVGAGYLQIQDETTAKKMKEIYKEVYRTGKSLKAVETKYTRKDGTKGDYEISVALTRDAKDKPIGFHGVSRDVTERKQAEEALVRSEEKYRRLVEDAQEGIYQSAVGYLTLNPALANMLGYDSPEEVMATITDIAQQLYVNPDGRKKLLEMVNEKGSVTDFETEYYKKDGSRIWVSINMHAVRDDLGHILYYQGINQDITEKKKIEAERQENIARLRKSLGATINAMAVTVETRDPYTAGHQRRVADLARAIATEMNLKGEQIDGVRMASMIHDIGKISIPSEILTKPTKLTALEFSIIKTHSQSGYDILKDIEFPWPVANVVLQHHERIDGTGYPQGLKGNDILLEARILAVADVAEAMASHRPYRPALGIKEALEEIEKNKGIIYDNTVADACLRLFREKSYHFHEM